VIFVSALAGWWLLKTPSPLPFGDLAGSTGVDEIAPATDKPAAPAVASAGPIIDIVRATPDGDVVVAGRASPGARVALLDNGKVLIETQADLATGEFVLLPSRLGGGDHHLAVRSSADGVETADRDVLAFTVSGKALNVEKPVASVSVDVSGGASASRTATVMPGDTLWRVSRAKLGRGALYPSIVQANASKIHNPNLIYPAQTLTIPPEAPAR
jgi:nucleoid-associated protein YgaU